MRMVGLGVVRIGGHKRTSNALFVSMIAFPTMEETSEFDPNSNTHTCGVRTCTPTHVCQQRNVFFSDLNKASADNVCEMNAMSDMMQVVYKLTVGQHSSGALNNVLTQRNNVD